MDRAILCLLLAALAACSTSQNPPQQLRKSAELLPSPNATYPSPDGSLYAAIRHSKRPYTVAIIERESGRVLSVAESSASISESGEGMYGTVCATYSEDLSTIVVHEDFSDASPNPRYILFQRRRGTAAYRVSYLAPPSAHTDAPGEFDIIKPRIVRVTNDTITLDYYDGRTRVIHISELLQTRTPKSSEGWPSEAYKRYERNR